MKSNLHVFTVFLAVLIARKDELIASPPPYLSGLRTHTFQTKTDDRERGTKYTANEKIQTIALSPNGRFLSAGGAEIGFIYVWDLVSGKLVHKLKGHPLSNPAKNIDAEFPTIAVVRLVFSPDNRFLATYGADSNLRLWDVGSGEMIFSRKTNAAGWSFSSDGKRIAGFTVTRTQLRGTLAEKLKQMQTTVEVIELTKKEVMSYSISESSVNSIGFLDDDKLIFTGHYEEIRLSAEYNGVPPKKPFAALRVWDATTGRKFSELGERAITTSAAVSANGHRVVASDSLRGITVWDRPFEKMSFILSHKSETNATGTPFALMSLVMSDNGEYVMSYDGTSLVLWDLTTKRSVFRKEYQPLGLMRGHGKYAISKRGDVLFYVNPNNGSEVLSMIIGRLPKN